MERRLITIEGIVQGVGYRPFIHGLACRLQLGGSVRNQADGVRVAVEGEPGVLDRFLGELNRRHPPLARIEQISWSPQPLRGERAFRIEASTRETDAAVFISPDAATCDDCLGELFDPSDRRYRYPFLNCTHCGPRLTIVRGSPYDRERTTMSGFVMCPACRAEYENPGDRRFHAQPTCCPECGPWLELKRGTGERIEQVEPLAGLAEALIEGRIGAIKGLGGYHLACDATREAAVAELRRRKHRDEKPLAVMVPNVEAAESWCEVGERERALLASPRRPIVLLRRREAEGRLGPPPSAGGETARRTPARGLAPGNPYLGVMLPYTPVHHLLMEAVGGRPVVMTSGNRSDEPIAYEDEDAMERLGGIADLLLTHNRPIHVRCDDSVTRIVAQRESPVRRSRGEAPQPIPLPLSCRAPILALGGQLKNTLALGRDRYAFLSHHIGDLDHYRAHRAFAQTVPLYEDLFQVQPEVIAHDDHPDYATTRFAGEYAKRERPGATLLAVQHHHAHLASCMAEHGLNEPTIGVCLDGTGYGTDGTIWGGEFLVGDYHGFERAGHLRAVGLPGGERAIRQPWRMALAHLRDSGLADDPVADRIPASSRRTVRQMLDRGVNSPLTSSAARLFDAVASLVGLRDEVSYEGQAAIELEWRAGQASEAGATRLEPYPFAWVAGEEVTRGGEGDGAHVEPQAAGAGASQPAWVDTRPLIRAVVRDVTRGEKTPMISRRFHLTVVEMIATGCGWIRKQRGVETVALSGGVFQNELLSRWTEQRLSEAGFRVHRHHRVPPNDGGLCLGQLVVAAAGMNQGESG